MRVIYESPERASVSNVEGEWSENDTIYARNGSTAQTGAGTSSGYADPVFRRDLDNCGNFLSACRKTTAIGMFFREAVPSKE
jgi:hypothetical protein|tara:strand:- start:369 stop:614 length:246 start_codon:yes stop_codon:yes gene_type:complete